MHIVRRSRERGFVDHGWLKATHTFSFASYYDPQFMGFHSLRVINQDRVAAGKGFGTHPHKDMEIMTYVIRGCVEHQDSMGHTAQIRPGEIQVMSAGTGISHSEYNPLPDQELELLQVWILPEQKDVVPSYAQAQIDNSKRQNAFCLLVSPDGADGSLKIHQQAKIFALLLDQGREISRELDPQMKYWLQVVKGELKVSDELELAPGDGLGLSQENTLKLTAKASAELLLFELA